MCMGQPNKVTVFFWCAFVGSKKAEMVTQSADDVEAGTSFTLGVLIGFIIVPLLIWLALNIVGTVYYAKLKNRQVEPGLEGFALATVILGWLGLPILNITSPIVYASTKPK